MSYEVFVSYSTKDMPTVLRLRGLIQGQGVNVFVAEHAVAPGEPLSARIAHAIKTCDVFLLLWSKSARESKWVSQELGIALGVNKLVIPVVLDGEPLQGFVDGIKYVPASQERDRALLKLQRNVFDRAKKKEREQGLVLLGLGAAALVLMGQR